MFKDCFEYWEAVIEDYLSCSDIDKNYTKEEIKLVAKKLLTDIDMWTVIDETVDYYLNELDKGDK